MIEVKSLSKEFGLKKAVDGVSFTVEKGEILGFLGPNGAGKSTTMRMITGFIPPSSGTAVIGGSDIVSDSLNAKKKMGYLPENAPVYAEMRVSDYLAFCAEIRGFSGGEGRQRVDETIEKCFLTDVRHQTVGTLSKGFKQRVCFAQSILHDPEYLILDEPTDGLDPNQKHEVRLMIRRMSADKAIILSTHILDEVDAVCTRAIIIAGGRVVTDDTPAGLRRRSELHGAVSLTLADAQSETVLPLLKAVEGVRSVRLIDNHAPDGKADEIKLRVFPESPDIPVAERILPLLSDYPIRSLFVEQGRLDQVFRQITADVQADG